MRKHSLAVSAAMSIALTLALVTGACATQPAQESIAPAVDPAALRELRAQLTRAQNAGDAAAFAGLSAADIVVLPADGSTIVGREAHVTTLREYFKTFTFEGDNISEEMVTSGNWAFDRGTYRFLETPKSGGSALVVEGNYMWLFRREGDGTWRLARVMWTTKPQPPTQR